MSKKTERRKGGQVTPNPHMGLSREYYDRIADIANECDMKMSDVMNSLLEYAFQHTRVEEVQVPVKKLRIGGK